MATLNPSNVINGNTIESSDIAQLYKAFGTGSGASITGLSMTGSLSGNASTATTASYTNLAQSVIIPTPPTPTGTYFPTLVPGVGTQNLEIGTLSYNAATNTLTTTASYATTALNASVSQVDSQRYDDGSTILTDNFKFIGGKVNMTSGAATSNAFSVLVGKILGVNAFITANYISGNGPTDSVIVGSINGSGAILFSNNTSGAPASAVIVFTGFYI
jgi:hypothetical protein